MIAAGITINGLPIVLKPPTGMFDLANLDRYYAEGVVGGTGAFMIAIREPAEFRTATRRKLLLEIAHRSEPTLPTPVQAAAPANASDCMAGEKQWRRYMEGAPR